MSSVMDRGVFAAARRMRLVLALLAGVCLAGFAGTGSGVIGVYRGTSMVAVSSGCVQIGADEWLAVEVLGKTPGATEAGVLLGKTYPRGFGGAWRPFRAGNARFSRWVFPLWQPMVVFGVGAAFAHGLVVGARRADRGSCAGCGYDVRTIPAGGKCPECGAVREGARAVARV